MATATATATATTTTLTLSYFHNSLPQPNRRSKTNPYPKPSNISVKSSSTSSKRWQVDYDFSLTKSISDSFNSGSIENALQLFGNANVYDTYLYNVMIKGLSNNGYFKEALDFYYKMVFENVVADNFTYPFVIKACSGCFALMEGKIIHGMVIKIGLAKDVYICNSLITFYGKVDCIEFAEKVFEEMPVRDLVSWNSMIGGYVSGGDGLRALGCFFCKMREYGVNADRFSIMHALAACSLVEDSMQNGKRIHCLVIRNGFELDVMVQTSLIDMYGKCDGVDYAERLFDRMNPKNIVAWNVMIGGYASNGHPVEALACFKRMQEADKLKPDVVTIINLLPSCAQLKMLSQGKSIHGFSIRQGLLPHVILETAIMDMYGACGEVELAKCMFDRMAGKNLISWNSMIATYVQNGLNWEAIDLFERLWSEPLQPDVTTVASVLPAYAEFASLSEGKQVHSYAIKLVGGLNIFISNAIIYMYAKCGDLQNARLSFDQMVTKDVISWNTIIMAYGIHGFGRTSIELFAEMQERGFKPNASTFVSLLTSCSITGLVDEGWQYYKSMKMEYGIDPGIEHYGCKLDLIGRTGSLDLAMRFIEEMPLVPTARIWGSLLVAARNNRNIVLAEFAAEHILRLKHDNMGCYVLLSNMYAEAGRWEDVVRIRGLMSKEGMQKTIGYSIFEINWKTHRFVNHDKSHVLTNVIYHALDIISRKIGEDVYVHNLNKFRPLETTKKRASSPANHSVRLAICFGLISTTIGHPVLVRNSTRICEDCHRAAKKMSEVTQREIVVGDSKAFHHFKDGKCSCGDYW